jgi:hypothetical protein
MRSIRKHAMTIVVAMVTAAVTAGGPALAGVIADYAKNADKVDGLHAVAAKASPTKAKGKLVATDSTGKFPAKFLQPYPIIASSRRNYDTLGAITMTAAGTHTAKILETQIKTPTSGKLLIDPWSSFYGSGTADSGLTWIEVDQATDCDSIGGQFPPNKVRGSRTLFEMGDDFYETVSAPITVTVAKGTHHIVLCATANEGSISAVDAGLNVLYVRQGKSQLLTRGAPHVAHSERIGS